MTDLTTCLDRAAASQGHACPRQVLAARMALHAGELLSIDLPRTDGRLIAFVELDGCFAEAVAAATGCSLGRRTLRPVDHGKLAATFLDAETGRAVRLAPRPGVTVQAAEHVTCPCRPAPLDPSLRLLRATGAATSCADPAPPAGDAAVVAHETMPLSELLRVQVVTLAQPLASLVGHDGAHVACGNCGEEMLSEREVALLGRRLCRACAGERYVVPVGPVGSSIYPTPMPRAATVSASAFASIPAYGAPLSPASQPDSRPASGRLVSVG